MKIGVPKEQKNNENRVGVTPGGAAEFIAHGHQVFVQHNAGEASGFPDEEYEKVGCKILPTIQEIYAIADMIYKVKEPIACEYPLIREGQIVFAYFHFVSEGELTEAFQKNKAISIAFETVRGPDGRSLPLLLPMSEVAGRMAAQKGATFLERENGGKGILMGGVPGVKPAKVLVLGGGAVGYFAAITAAGMGANVIITDISVPRLTQLREILPANVHTLFSSKYNIIKELPDCDLVIGAALVPGDKAPHLVDKQMLSYLQKGSVLVDVAIDQGGCFETSHPTTHSEPIFTVDGIIHYCVTNIPGAVPMTSTPALANSTLPYGLKIADKGWKKACEEDSGLAQGLNFVNGKCVFKAVADCFHIPCESWK